MRLRDAVLGYLTLVLGALSSAEAGKKYSINDHLAQILRIVEDTAHSINGIEITMDPSYFNYLVPFTTKVNCTDGTMDVIGMEHTPIDDSYMEVMNETHSYLQARFSIADLSYKYNFCWLDVGVPVPIWLEGKLMDSHYFVSAVLSYEPECTVDIQKAKIISYGELTVNFFQWMPGVIGNWLLDAITRNAEDQIFATVEKSIQTNAYALTETYNPCIVFPSMGRMTPHVGNHEITYDESLKESSYIGDLLDEVDKIEQFQQDSEENSVKNSVGIENIEQVSDIQKTEL